MPARSFSFAGGSESAGAGPATAKEKKPAYGPNLVYNRGVEF